MKLAKEFLKEYGCKSGITLPRLKEIISEQGFEIIHFSPVEHDDNITELLSLLKLREKSKTLNAFTYMDDTKRIVFVRSFLSAKEQLILLAHEEGHIYCDLLYKRGSGNTSVLREDQAARFGQRIVQGNIITGERITVALSIAAFALSFVGFISPKTIAKHTTYTVPQYESSAEAEVPNDYVKEQTFSIETEVAITPTGHKYHRPTCGSAQGDNTILVAEEQAIQLGLQPCKNCNPDMK